MLQGPAFQRPCTYLRNGGFSLTPMGRPRARRELFGQLHRPPGHREWVVSAAAALVVHPRRLAREGTPPAWGSGPGGRFLCLQPPRAAETATWGDPGGPLEIERR